MMAQRELITNTGEKVLFYISVPEKNPDSNDYFCIMGLKGQEINFTRKIYGIDSMQALFLSISHIDGLIKTWSAAISPEFLIWESGSTQNDLGLGDLYSK